MIQQIRTVFKFSNALFLRKDNKKLGDCAKLYSLFGLMTTAKSLHGDKL